MPRATSYQYSFNAGEWSPTVAGRIDLQKRRQAMSKMQNFVPLIQGAMTRRPGTWYVEPAKTNSANMRLKRFEFNAQQSYILEFGDKYIRFFTNQGQLLSGGTPYEVVTPYAGTDVADLGFTQSADTLYIAHPNYAPRKLQRLGATNWQLNTIAFQDGPYLPQNVSGTYITSSVSFTGSSGTLTATSADGINGGAGFGAGDVGRVLRIGTKGTDANGNDIIKWIWGQITAVTDATHASWTVMGVTPL